VLPALRRKKKLRHQGEAKRKEPLAYYIPEKATPVAAIGTCTVKASMALQDTRKSNLQPVLLSLSKHLARQTNF
jgi:hypothetical protein